MRKLFGRVWKGATRPPGNDLRNAPRYQAVRCPAVLGWWQGGQFTAADALIQDISLTGAAVRAQARPGDTSDVSLRLATDPAGTWVPVTVVSAERARPGPFLIRVQFLGSCPYDFFQAVVNLSAYHAHPSPEGEAYDGRIWR